MRVRLAEETPVVPLVLLQQQIALDQIALPSESLNSQQERSCLNTYKNIRHPTTFSPPKCRMPI